MGNKPNMLVSLIQIKLDLLPYLSDTDGAYTSVFRA